MKSLLPRWAAVLFYSKPTRRKVSGAPGSPCLVLARERHVQSGGFEGRPERHRFVYGAPEARCAAGAEAPAATPAGTAVTAQLAYRSGLRCFTVSAGVCVPSSITSQLCDLCLKRGVRFIFCKQ